MKPLFKLLHRLFVLVFIGAGASLLFGAVNDSQPGETQIPLPEESGTRGLELSISPEAQLDGEEEVGRERMALDDGWKAEETALEIDLPSLGKLGLPVEPPPSVKIVSLEFEGNSVFEDSELEQVVVAEVGDYRERNYTAEDLEIARMAITTHYLTNGYVNSGALIPEQDLESGVFCLNVVEGNLTEIRISRTKRQYPLKDVRFTGNSLVPTVDLRGIALAGLNSAKLPLDQETLGRTVSNLNRLYLDEGYVGSGVLSPRADLKEGILYFEVVEGDQQSSGTWEGMEVAGFEFEGNTAVPGEELESVVMAQVLTSGSKLPAAYSRETVALAMGAIAQAYHEKGYVSTGAVTPDLDTETKTLQFTIQEGEEVEQPKERKWVRDSYYANRLRRQGHSAYNMTETQGRLELLTLSPLVDRINAEVKPGGEMGEAHLQVQVDESFPIRGGMEIHNRRPVSSGPTQIEFWLNHDSLLGFGDRFYFTYGLIDGGFDETEFSGIDDFGVQYYLPISPSDTMLVAGYSQTSYTVVEEPFSLLDIEGESRNMNVGIEHPLFRNLQEELVFGFRFERMHSETSLFDIPFSITPGAIDGEIDMSVLRASLDWVRRSQTDVLALRASGAVGVDWFGTTDDGSSRDDDFFVGQFQGQYIKRLSEESDTQILVKGGLQLADSKLLAPMQWTTGGYHTVRGYRENSFVRDIGYFASVEGHLPLFYHNDREVLRLIPFFDVGGAKDGGGEDDGEFQNIYSMGLGLRFVPLEVLNAELFWGYAFEDLDNPHDSLQDNGFHFKVGTSF